MMHGCAWFERSPTADLTQIKDTGEDVAEMTARVQGTGPEEGFESP